MATTTRAKFDIKTEASKPLFATVGATDLAVEAVRDYVADVQKNVASLEFKPAALRAQARTAVTERVEAISKDAKTRRTEIEKRVADLQAEAKTVPARVQKALDDNVSALGGTYEDLVKRGESLVKRIRKQAASQEVVKDAKTTVAKAKATKTSATKAAKSASTTAKSTAKKASTTAKKTTATTRSNAKATVTAAKKTAAATAKAVTDAAEKIGD